MSLGPELSTLALPPEAGSEAAVLLAMPFLTMGGGEAAVSQICRQLKNAGFRIFVITTEPAAECLGDTTEWFADSCSIYHLPRSLPSRKWKRFISRLIAQNRIDVIWLAGSSFVYNLLPKLKQRFRNLAVVDLLFNPVGHTANHLKFAKYIDHVAVEHTGMQGWLVAHGRDIAAISVIPNGVDARKFVRSPRRDWRTGGTRPEGQPPFTIGFLGRFSKEKGPDIFVDLAVRLRAYPQVEFLMCGAGVMESSLQQQIAAEIMGDRVHMLGFRKTVDCLPCCDVVVICSRLDGRPNILMESLSMGVPVVAWGVGGIPEMAPDGSGVTLVDPGDVEGLEAAIVRLMVQPEIRRGLAESGFRFAAGHFSSEAAGAGYARLFRGLINAKSIDGYEGADPMGPVRASAGGFLAGIRSTLRRKLLGGR
jgi:glycosyltransferase involved in cell wall biosynthesis